MFREVITVKWKDNYTAKKIALSKEISNVSNSYHIRIQVYELEQKIDGETVFILQLKHNRNVRNVASTHSTHSHSHSHAPIIGISMHNQYRMAPIIQQKQQTSDTQQHNKCILQHTRKRSSSSFFDQIWLQHKSKSILHATVNTIFRAFDCDDFIQYNEHANQFEFNFDAKPKMTRLTKYVSLSRTKYTEQEAETLLKDRHHAFEKIKPCKVQVCCVNAHEIEDKDWDFEVNLTLLPGRYQFYIDELFGKVATQIHARDYPQIRQFYQKQLKKFVSDRNIFDVYLRHLSTFEPRYKMMEWSKNGVESGPLFGLYSILCQIDSSDPIWNNLFEICLRDKIEDEIIRHTISEQTVADFIALSLKHYVKDSVKRRIQSIENDVNNKKHNSNHNNNKEKEESEYILSESDRYILSIILPYFGSPALKTIHKSVAKESLPSGLFNHFCDEIQAEDEDKDKWCMKVEPLQLKNDLLTHLYKKGYDVVKQYYLAVYQYTPAVEKTDKSQWTFYIRPSTYSEIFNGAHKINMNAYTFYDKFEFQQRNMPNTAYLNLIIKCVDVSFECDWAMWARKKLKMFKASLGYWKILNTSDERPRVPVDHLDAILALLRHDAMSISPKLLRNEKQLLSVVFLKENSGNNKWSEDKVDAEYQLTWWNGRKTGNSSLSLKLLKFPFANQMSPKHQKVLREKDSYFIHYRSKDANIKWLWYDNDKAKHCEYRGESVPKQLEATYLGVSETMFPVDQFKRERKGNIKEHIFNCASMPELTKALNAKKPFVLRYAFDRYDRDKIRNIEQLAINNYYDQFPRSVSRVYSGKYGLRINNEDRRVSSLGEMTIYQSNKSIIICWKFKKNPELSLFKTYHYKVQIPIKYENKFQRLLVHWRRDTLFGQTMANRALCIQQSRMWKNDRKMPPVKEVTVEYNKDKKGDDYDNDFGANTYDDDDDDKDEEKQSKKSKKEECIPCQMIASNDEEEVRRRELAHAHDEDDNDDDEDNIDIAKKVTDAEWDLLDILDDKQRAIYIMKPNPVYKESFVPEAESVFDLWIKSHKPQKFRKTLYRLVSLTFVQSIISVMKHHAINNKKKKNKNLMIVISNTQNMYRDAFDLTDSDYIATNSKLLSYLFDGVGDIKRIDSKGNIYSISLGDDLPQNENLHEFIRMTSKKYKETLVLFTRENSNNLYISHSGFISKLSLDLHDEDLHYFLPLFIPLKVGDCVNIEAFSSPDSGTIVSLWRNNEKNNIVYRIRSTQNVYYIMNYYQLVNRAPPKTYWYDIRKNFIKDSSTWNDVKLWKTEKSAQDPSDANHPLHGVILALVESSKQAIASIESQLNNMMSERRSGKKKKFEEGKQFAIQHKLQNTGAIFLFYKTVQIEDKSDEILEFERETKERDEYDDDNEAFQGEKSSKAKPKKYKSHDDDDDDDDFNSDDDEDLKESNPKGLNHLIKFLKRNKLISNVREYESPQRTSYDLFCSKAADIFNLNAPNRVFVCHMIETKKYVLEQCDDGNNSEQAIDIDSGTEIITNNETTAMPDDDPFNLMNDEDDEWLTLEPDADDILRKEDSAEPKQKVVIKSAFECAVKFSFEMSCVAEPVLTVEELMVMMKDKKNWSTEDHKLLTQFHANNIYNKFDLLDKKLIKKLKLKLFGAQNPHNRQLENVHDKNLALLEKKFLAFTECVEELLTSANIKSPLTQYVIAGVEVTRNARLLQGYIDKFRRYKNDVDNTDDDDLEIISSNTDHTMIVSYNPIQTVVVTSRMIKDVTHPIHLYRAAYDEKFYPRNQIKHLHAEWMQTQSRLGNIIKSISALLRYNKKYEIILVPSSVHLSSEKFLKPRCSMVAPEHEAIADYRITFLYKGLLYRYDRKKAKKFFEKYKKYSCMVSDDSNKHIRDYIGDDLDDERDDNKVYTDEIKFLLRVLHNNISEEQPDAMDPSVASHDDIFPDQIKRMISINNEQKRGESQAAAAAAPESPDLPAADIQNETKFRLRASIKRKHTDRIFRWLNIGTGACHLHETGAHSKEIGPKQGTDFEKEFPKILQRAMFLYYIDCRVPFNEDIIPQDSQCAICKQLMIDPATIGHPDCKHIFCKLCIQQWYFVNYQEEQQQQMNAYGNNNNNNNNLNNNNRQCPVCRRQIEKITVSAQFVKQMKKGIPSTIYQQIMDDNQSRFLRQYLLDSFLTERERVLEAEYSQQQQQQQQAPQSQANLQQQMQNNPRLQQQLAGY